MLADLHQLAVGRNFAFGIPDKRPHFGRQGIEIPFHVGVAVHHLNHLCFSLTQRRRAIQGKYFIVFWRGKNEILRYPQQRPEAGCRICEKADGEDAADLHQACIKADCP